MNAEKFRDGWGVAIIPLWDDDESISDIIVEVLNLSPVNWHIVGNMLCVKGESGIYHPVENFQPREPLQYDDQHDLRDTWFASCTEACEHANYVRDTWRNPLPWQSFITLH